MPALDRIKGSITALITPFKNGAVDEEAFRRIVNWQIAEGTEGLVPCGTTGESPTLTDAEHMRLIEVCVEAACGRVPVLAGAGSNSTAQAIMLSRHSKKVGADAALSVVPYYNKPTQEGLYRHFAKIAESVDIPIVIYNVPSRTVADISVETLARLAKIANIFGIKDATGNMARASRERAALPEKFIRLSGEDATTLGFMAHGGHGCISVTSNIAPHQCAEFQNACLAGNFAAALKLQDRLMPLHDALFVETSPGPVKYAASLLGLCADAVRQPLVPPGEPTQKIVREAMRHAGIFNG